MPVRTRSLLPLSAAAILLLSGCWEMPGQGPDRRSHNPFEDQITVETVDSLTEAWTAEPGADAVGAPVLSGAGVHVTTYDADGVPLLHTAHVETGDSRWTVTLDAPPPVADVGEPVVSGEQVLVGYGYGNLGGSWTATAFDAATGAQQGDVGTGMIDTRRGSLLGLFGYRFGSGGPCGTFIELADLDDPDAGWNGITAVSSFGCPDGSAPTIAEAAVYHAGPGPLTPEPGSDPALGNAIREYSISPPPNCTPGGLYVPCPSWATPLDGETSTSPVISEDGATLYTGTDSGTVYAVDAATGVIEWSASVGAEVAAPPALANGTLFVPTAGRDVVAVAAGGCGFPTCSPLWKGVGGGTLTVQPAIAGGVVFTGGAQGALKGYSADGCGAPVCSALWTTTTGSRITGAPAVTGGRLYVGTQDGRLIAYSPGGA